MKTARPPVPTSLVKGGDKAGADTFERECIEFFVEVVQVIGVPRSVGQIYGLLFASPQPLSFTDIVEHLDLSKGSASQGLQFLRSLGAVRSVGLSPAPVAGSLSHPLLTHNHGGSAAARRERYEPEIGLRKLMGGLLREKVEPLMDGGGERLRRLRERAEQMDSDEQGKFSLDRVKQLESWRRQLWLLLPVFKTILGPGSA